jgi:hypothetical protein
MCTRAAHEGHAEHDSAEQDRATYRWVRVPLHASASGEPTPAGSYSSVPFTRLHRELTPTRRSGRSRKGQRWNGSCEADTPHSVTER